MKMTKKVSDLLNEQFYNELYAAHLYFAISACMRLTPYPGVAKWMQIQAREEIGHAEKIYEYLIERRVQFKTSSVQKPETDVFASPLDGFKAALQYVDNDLFKNI